MNFVYQMFMTMGVSDPKVLWLVQIFITPFMHDNVYVGD